MTVYVYLIDPDGSVIPCEGADLLTLTREHIGESADVVTLSHPAFGGGEIGVGAINDWGRMDGLPLNVKAWALYGRSPIVGPMLVALDGSGASRPPFPSEVHDLLIDPTFPPANMRGAMKDALVVANTDGSMPLVLWPEGW